MINQARRIMLQGGLALGVVTLVGLKYTSKAIAAGKELKDWMMDRINSVYNADKAFKVRASQDNFQVKTLYKSFLGQPGSEISHKYLHMHFIDRSKNLENLRETGEFPNPRAEEFESTTYPYE